MIRERSERKKIFFYPHFSKCGGYKQANVSFKYTEICCLVVALINISWAYSIRISKRDIFTFQQWQLKLEGCIMLNERNAVSTRIGPLCNCFPGPTRVLNANAVSIASEFSEGLTRWHTDRQTDRPSCYLVVHNRRHLPTY